MSYLLYKLKFPNGIHLGVANNEGLESTSLTFYSDAFYSAFYSEYMKIYNDNKLYEISEKGEFKVSDLFPFKEIKSQEPIFYLPKPFVNIDRDEANTKKEIKIDRKKIKNLSYIPASKLKEYFSFLENGEVFPEIDENFGKKQLYTKNKVSKEEDTKLYNIEVFKFNKNSGLYFIMQIPNKNQDEWLEKIENVLESLSLSGIGGKKSSGYGQFKMDFDPLSFDGEDFDIIESEDDAFINKALYKEEKKYFLLSSYSPKKEEIIKLKDKESSYSIIKRSGFVNNFLYSEQAQKRKQIYMISSGSIINFKPEGRIVDLKLHGNHSIYRMGKPIVLGVNLWQR